MLEFLRRGVKSWVVKVLLGLLVVSFAVWGIGDVTTGFSTRVATVGGQTVEAGLFGATLRQEQQRYQLDATQIRPLGLDRFVLGRMVRDAALAEAAERLGVSAPDEAVARAVRAEPAFSAAGQFDPVQYAAAVRRVFPSVAVYEQTLRQSLAAGLIERAAAAAAPLPGLAPALAAWREEARRFEAITLTVLNLQGPDPVPSDADLAAHLEAARAAFAEPERRDAVWLRIDPSAMAAEVAIPEEELRAAYEGRRAEYETAERRVVDQIVFPTEAEAAAASARLADGSATFDALLAERSLSRGDAALGEVEAGDLRDARGPAAFALPGPGVAGPAATAGGFALLEVRAVTPGRTTPFEEVREALRTEAALARIQPDLDRLSELAADALAGGATIEEAAAELGLTPGGVAGLSADGALAGGAPAFGLPAEPAFLAELFAAPEGADRDPVRLPDGGAFALRVTAVTAPRDPALEDVRDRVAESWTAARRSEALAALGESARDRVAAGEDMAAVAADLGAVVESIGPLRRGDPDPRLDEAARAALFAAEPGAVALARPVQLAVVARLAEVIPAEPDGPAAREIAEALEAAVGRDQIEFLGRALEAEAGVTYNLQAIESVLSGLGG
jgi:peptidyl-prolyl cis-trans isomerase D